PLAEVLVTQQNFIGWLKKQEEETVKNKKKVKTTYNQLAIENQQGIQNVLETIDVQKNDQNSKNSLPPPKIKEVEVNNKQHMTGDMEIDRIDDNQLKIEEEA
ncbi:9168_t:CDS:2, partial [Gigaspora margarita]